MTEDPRLPGELKRNVGLFGVVALGLGTAVGVSIFSVLAPAAAIAGPAMLVSMVIAVVPMIVFALIYAFMGAAAPATGASFEWPRRFVHPFAGFIISWMRIAGSTAALIVLTMVLVSYMATVIALPSKLAMLGINADVTEREQSGRTVYRVRVGPFNQKALADLTQEQLEVNGVEAALVRVQR